MTPPERKISSRRTAAALLATVFVTSSVLAAPPPAAAIAYPDSISSVSSQTRPDGVVLTWQSAGRNTSHYLLQTGLTSFSSGSQGRFPTTFRIPGTARSFLMGEVQLAQAGAAIGTGRHLYYRLSAVNVAGSSSATRAYPYLKAFMPPGLAAKKEGTVVRAATFNVRTAKATWDKRHWVKRKAQVATEIKDSEANVVAIQELSPGRQDGRDGSTKKVGRQTTSLVVELRKIGLGHFKLVRETQYKKPGTVHGTQGTRILYNSRTYELLSDCPEKTGRKNWNPACSIDLPIMTGDSGKAKRKAAYAAFEDRNTGKRFFVVSAHLDQRHSKVAATEQKYNALRDAQVKTILDRVDRVNTKNRAVIFGGDINSWQNNFVGHAPHDRLIANGYYDTVAATKQINLQYPTVNHFKLVLPPSEIGVGTRIDAVLVQGAQGSNLYWNKTSATDSERPSDHNLVAADIVL